MKTYYRETVFVEMKKFCYLSKEHDFMELTIWENGEGFDVSINEGMFSLTWGQFKALKVLAAEVS